MTELLKKAFGWTVLRRAAQAESRLQRSMPEAWATIQATRAAGGLSHGMQPLRLIEVAALIERFAPTTVLELGGGTTTEMFARRIPCVAGVPCITSMEESEHWQAITRSLLSPELQARVRFRLAPRVVELREGRRVARYDMQYDEGYDFVYLDGPSPHDPEDRRPRVRLPLVDVLRLIEAGMSPRVIAIDSRRQTVDYLREHGIERHYRMALQSAYRHPILGLLQPYHHHTVLVRK